MKERSFQVIHVLHIIPVQLGSIILHTYLSAFNSPSTLFEGCSFNTLMQPFICTTHTCMQKYSFKRKVIPFCPSPLTVITHPHTQKKHMWTTIYSSSTDLDLEVLRCVEILKLPRLLFSMKWINRHHKNIPCDRCAISHRIAFVWWTLMKFK